MAICESHRANCIDVDAIVEQLNSTFEAGTPLETAQEQESQGDGKESKKSVPNRLIRQSSCQYRSGKEK
jgi:hypothetical protein